MTVRERETAPPQIDYELASADKQHPELLALRENAIKYTGGNLFLARIALVGTDRFHALMAPFEQDGAITTVTRRVGLPEIQGHLDVVTKHSPEEEIARLKGPLLPLKGDVIDMPFTRGKLSRVGLRSVEQPPEVALSWAGQRLSVGPELTTWSNGEDTVALTELEVQLLLADPDFAVARKSLAGLTQAWQKSRNQV